MVNNSIIEDSKDSSVNGIASHKDLSKDKLVDTTPRRNGPRIGFGSDIGRKRTIDEDSIVVMDLMTAFVSKKRNAAILVLADGMGGHGQGEVASKIGASTAATKLYESMILNGMNSKTYYESISAAISAANRKILEYTHSNSQYEGMGTTISVAVIDEDMLYLGNVGDSRVYVINEEYGITQVTKDHSVVQEMVDRGELSEKDANTHPKKNVITRVVGYYGEVIPDIFSLRLDKKDFVLLSCDGLTNDVSDEEIKKIVLDSNSVQTSCDKLIKLANQRGGKDNISVIIADVNSYSTFT